MKNNSFNSPSAFEKLNKDYYINVEDYDWVKVTDNFIGLESFFHYLRQKNFLNEYYKLKDQLGDMILDAGCGTGLITRHLPKNSTGIDINPRHIEKAKINAPLINFLVADLEHLPFPDNHFSTIICTEVIEHFPDPEKPLQELSRVLKRGGYLLGTVPRRSFFWHFRFLSSTKPREPYHHYYVKKELHQLLQKFFQIIKLQKTNLNSTWLFLLKK